MNLTESHKTWLALNHLYGISQNDMEIFLRHFDELPQWLFKSSAFLVAKGFSDGIVTRIKSLNWQEVDDEMIWLNAPNRHLITIKDQKYPELLKEIAWPPMVLFVEGNVSCLQQHQLAMVGSRNPSPLGVELAENFAAALASNGLVVTSGLARGIDSASHRGALQKGKTIAVLGTGLDIIYPASNRKLAEDILLNQGALVSEFPLKTLAKKENFPRRNRIISGLSVGVLVVEATVRSGSLITAKFAANQNREVFAIPGSIYHPLSRGCHYLIKQGAKVVETIEDIFSELEYLEWQAITRHEAKNESSPLDKGCQKLLSCTDFKVTAVDTIILRSGCNAEKVGFMLLTLELSGYVKSVPGGYIRIR